MASAASSSAGRQARGGTAGDAGVMRAASGSGLRATRAHARRSRSATAPARRGWRADQANTPPAAAIAASEAAKARTSARVRRPSASSSAIPTAAAATTAAFSTVGSQAQRRAPARPAPPSRAQRQAAPAKPSAPHATSPTPPAARVIATSRPVESRPPAARAMRRIITPLAQ